MHMKTRDKIIYSFIIFSIGLTLGKVIDWGYFELSKEISIIDALTLIVTVGLGLYIAKVLESEVQNDRIEKDLYLSKISEIEEHLSTLEHLIEGDNISYLQITNQLHLCNIKRNLIFNNIKSITNNKLQSELVAKEKTLKRRNRRLRNLLTNSPREGEINNNILIEDNIIIYSPERIIEILSESNSIKDELFRVKIIVNLK